MIFDTDILIWFFRGDANAVATVKDNRPFGISVVTSMEIMQGMRDKTELMRALNMFADFRVTILHINESVSRLAEMFVQKYALSHAMKLPDALIAATSIVYQVPLLTGNDKHYRFIPNLDIHVFRPHG